MSLNPVIDMLGRRLRLAVIGGGTGSFIGAMHRQSARRDDRYQIVTGIFSSDPAKSKKDASELGFESDRIYSSVKELYEKESSRKDGIDAVAIMTPNDSHFDYSMWALERGIDVICDKPMTNTLAEAEALHKKVQETGLVFCLTHNYTGYPMVRQAKAMVEAGELGTIRLVQVEYVQGGKADENKVFPAGYWKFDPARGGPSLVMGDIGSHAHNLTRFITGLEIDEVSAEIGAIVPNRLVHDFGGAMLRFNNGARGSFWVTQAAAGVENCLRIRVSGTKGSLEWMQEIPASAHLQTIGRAISKPHAERTWHIAALCSLHSLGRRASRRFPRWLCKYLFRCRRSDCCSPRRQTRRPARALLPQLLRWLMGVRFVDSVVASSNANGQWTKC